jgi:hypothetical protein
LHGRPRTRAAGTDGVRGGRLCRLDVRSGAERAFPCVCPLPGRFPGAGRPGKGGCGDGQNGGPGERDACQASGAGAGRSRVRLRGTRLWAPVRRRGCLAGERGLRNSVRHSGSGAPGVAVTVAVIAGDGVVRVEVTDRAGPGTPELRPVGRDAEGGRGLQLVAGLPARWGWRRHGRRASGRSSGWTAGARGEEGR